MQRTRMQSSRLGSGGQSGAVLYVAMIMLILLALIGVIGMQVATMQERMAANYLASNRAFQRAESSVRAREVEIGAGGVFDYENCAVPYDPVAWAGSIADNVAATVRTRNISNCLGECTAAAGVDMSESQCNKFRTTAFSRDQDSAADSSALSAVDTIYIRP